MPEDEAVQQGTAKKQNTDWDECSGFNYSKEALAEGESGLSPVKREGESRSDTGSSSIDIDNDDKKIEPAIFLEELPDAGKKEPAKKVDPSKASGLDSDSRTDEDMDNVATSSKKLLASSATVNDISSKKVGSSNDSPHDSGLDEDDVVRKTHVTSSLRKLPASPVAQREGIEKNENSYNGSREGFDECNHIMVAGTNQMKDDDTVDATSTVAARKPKTDFTPEKQNATSKKLFVGCLPNEVKRANLETFFNDCGEIVDVTFGLYRDGTFRGFAHVEFATEEAAQNALMLNGTALLGRFVNIEIAREKFAYNSNSRNNTLKGFHASLRQDEPTMSATSKEQNATSKMLFVGNLSYSVEKDDLDNLFKDCGEIVDIRFATDREGRFKGFAHVLFATEEAAQIALMLNGKELLRRPVRLDLAHERGAYSRSSNNWNESFQEDISLGENEAKMPSAPKEQKATSKTVFVGNLSYRVERADLENLFKDCGEIIDIRLATDREGRFKGFGHVEFATHVAAQNALKLNGKELLRQYVKLDLANEKIVHSSNSSIQENRDDSETVECLTVFVRGFNTSLRESEIRTILVEHFSSCGIILGMSIARDSDTGSIKGYAWIDFMEVDGFNKALRLDGTNVRGYILSVEKRKPRRWIQGGRGGGDHYGGGWSGGDQSGGGWRGGDQSDRGWRGGDQSGPGWRDSDQSGRGWRGDNQCRSAWGVGDQFGSGWRGGDRSGGWRGGDQSGGCHGGGQWHEGRGYDRRWH